MKKLEKFSIKIRKGEKWYVAHCVELGVVSQGKTLKSACNNIGEAIELFLE